MRRYATAERVEDRTFLSFLGGDQRGERVAMPYTATLTRGP